MNLNLLWLIPLLPLAGFLINGTVGRKLPRAAVTAIALLFTAAPAAIVAMLWRYMLSTGTQALSITSAPWIQITGFHVDFAFAVDHLTLIMLAVVTGVGFLIHVYSAGYMAHEEGFWRFFAYLNLFMFFMLTLVLSANFLLLFVGWEGVGLASYLLIGFYFTKDSAANAGKKAFIVNRIGDFGFLLAMFLLIAHFGTLNFSSVFAAIAAMPTGVTGGFLTTICLLLVLGAAGKSAQIPLYIWLPDAMEGPTPVSALIHAATMVTAGIYMVARCHVLFDRSPTALLVVACIGAATALMAATIGLVQQDIKRVLAYSTVSQLGYMFMACGVGAYSAAIFHLMTHAFFKALLFLAAGSVIHALSGQQDMRLMGGLWRRIPITFWTMTAGVIAIAGIYPFAGFFSKDEILYRTFVHNGTQGHLLWAVGVLTAFLTSFYMFRLWFKTFFGAPRFEDPTHLHAPDLHAGHAAAVHTRHDHGHTAPTEPSHHHGVHESAWSMTVPLVVLAALAIVGGLVGVPAALGGNNHFEHFLDPVFALTSTPENALNADQISHTLERVLAAISVAGALLGLLLAYVFYYRKPGTAASLARRAKPLYSLLGHKYWVDELYAMVITAPLLMLSRILLGGVVEGGIIQGSADATVLSSRGLGTLVRRMQSGNIRSYAGWLSFGAAVVIAIVLFGHTIHAGTR